MLDLIKEDSVGQIIEQDQDNRRVIWQSNSDEVSQGHIHRIVQIASDDCIVESRVHKNGEPDTWAPNDPGPWEAEEHDAYVANAYMIALLEARALWLKEANASRPPGSLKIE